MGVGTLSTLLRDAVHGAGAVRGAGAVQGSGVSTKRKQQGDLHSSFYAQGCRWVYISGPANGLCWDRLGSSDVMESLFLDFAVLVTEAGPWPLSFAVSMPSLW